MTKINSLSRANVAMVAPHDGQQIRRVEQAYLPSDKIRGYRVLVLKNILQKHLNFIAEPISFGKDYRQEKRGIFYQGNLVSPNNNPLYHKAGAFYRPFVTDQTKHFVRFPVYSDKTKRYNHNHHLIVPKQEANPLPYIDYRDFIRRASGGEKLDLCHAIHKSSHTNSRIYMNVGAAREIPYFHVHIGNPKHPKSDSGQA